MQGFSGEHYSGLFLTDRLQLPDMKLIKFIKLSDLLEGLEEGVMREPDSAQNDSRQMYQEELTR